MKITENELITLIEKIVNEQGVAFGGFGENMGVSKPTDKYKDLNLEGGDIDGSEVEEQVQPSEDQPVMKFPKMKVEILWPKLPKWFRNLFLKKHRNSPKFKGCNITSCTGWDKSSNDEKNDLKVGIESGPEIDDVVNDSFNESEIVERLRKRMGPQKFPKKVSEQIINKKPITEENVKITQATMERYMDVKFRELKDQNFVHLQRLTGLIEDNGRNK